jgi:hypothetical protein
LQTSEKLIRQAIDEGWMNSLAFYYLLKKRVVNSTIYGSRLKTVVEKTGSSYRTCKKHLNILYKKGLIVKHGGNFVTPKPEFVCFVGVNICDIPGMFTYQGRLYKAHATRYIPLRYPITA